MAEEIIENPRGKDEEAAEKIKKKKKPAPTWRVILEALVIAGLVHTLLFRPFFIPSGSMKPNLLVGDYIIINKFSYGYSRHSCYFAACPIEGRIFGKDPERGDVVVFSNPGPQNHNKAYVKRVVGLPGDRVQMRDGILFINGEPAPQQPMADYAEPLSDYAHEDICKRQDAEYCYIEQAMETLPNGYAHTVFNTGDNGPYDNTDEWTVTEGHYFVMGDNRDRSADSRVNVGLVPEERLIGKAKLIVFSSSGSSLFQFWKWRGDRFFQWIK